MADITHENLRYKQIDQMSALYDLKLESPKAYLAVCRLREEHECLMKLPIDKLIPIMKRAVEGLIEDGFCKKKHEPSELLNNI